MFGLRKKISKQLTGKDVQKALTKTKMAMLLLYRAEQDNQT